MNLFDVFPQWKLLAINYIETHTIKQLHFISIEQAVKTYGLLADSGYRVGIEIDAYKASVITVWLRKT